jgi:hypothetical protein
MQHMGFSNWDLGVVILNSTINIPSNDISVELNNDVDIPLFNHDEIEFDNPPVNIPHPRPLSPSSQLLTITKIFQTLLNVRVYDRGRLSSQNRV